MEVPQIQFFDYPTLPLEVKDWLRSRSTEITAMLLKSGRPYAVALIVHPALIKPGTTAEIEVFGNLLALEDYAQVLRSTADYIEARERAPMPKPAGDPV